MEIFNRMTLLRMQEPRVTSSPPGVAGSVSLVSGQRVQVLETGALINTVTKAVLFRSACMSQRQGDRMSCCFVVPFVWADNEYLLPPSPIEDEWKAFFEPEICQLEILGWFLQLGGRWMTVLVWLECFFTQKMNGWWCNCTLEGSRRVNVVTLFCKQHFSHQMPLNLIL